MLFHLPPRFLSKWFSLSTRARALLLFVPSATFPDDRHPKRPHLAPLHRHPHIPLVFRSSQTSLVFVVLHLFVSLGLSILSPSLHENVSPPEANGFVCFPAPARTREGASDAF